MRGRVIHYAHLAFFRQLMSIPQCTVTLLRFAHLQAVYLHARFKRPPIRGVLGSMSPCKTPPTLPTAVMTYFVHQPQWHVSSRCQQWLLLLPEPTAGLYRQCDRPTCCCHVLEPKPAGLQHPPHVGTSSPGRALYERSLEGRAGVGGRAADKEVSSLGSQVGSGCVKTEDESEVEGAVEVLSN